MTTEKENDFYDPSWDNKLQNWIQGSLPPAELSALQEKLSFDAQFRESFGDWVRNLRELGWNVRKKEVL